METELTLNAVVDVIVEIVDGAISRGKEIAADEIHAAVLERYPGTQEALLELAFAGAAERLRAAAERDQAEADELRQYQQQRRARRR